MEKTTKIPLFRRCVIQNFPFIEEDFDALTDYGLLCKVVEYLNKVINQTNATTDQVEELTTAFNSLKSYVDNYFDNLDVQEEINSKLEAMAASGQLADIISQYLNSTAIFGYDTLADMKAAENLVDGSYARTLGYYTKNDGGAGLYKIRNITNDDVVDEAFIVEMGDGSDQLVAELIFGTEVNANQLGAYGDGTHDDTTAIQNGINKLATLGNKGTLKLLSKTYIVENLDVKSYVNIIGNGFKNSVLKAKSTATGALITISQMNDNYITLSDFKIDGDKTNNTLSAGILCDKGTDYVNSADAFCTFKNLLISNVYGDGIKNYRGGRENRFINIIVEYCGGYGINSSSSDSYFEGITCKFNYKNGIYVNSGACRFVNIKCFLNGYENSGANREDIAGFLVNGINNTFTGCDAQENYGDGFYIKQSYNSFTNCVADANGFKSQRYNPDGTYADMTDEELEYDGFYVLQSGYQIKGCTFVVLANDHRRADNHQLQRYGLNMGQLVNSSIILTGFNNVAPLYAASTYQENINYYGANNYIEVNGKIIGGEMVQRLVFENTADLRNAIDFFAGTDNTRKVRVTSNGTKVIQMNNMNGATYGDTFFAVSLNENNDGSITLGDTNNHYTLNFNPRGLGFFGKSPVGQQNTIADSTDLASVITLANGLKDVLQAYGLMQADS